MTSSNELIASFLRDPEAQRRFGRFIAVGSPDACWPWTGHCTIGYGRFKYGGKSGRSLLATRLAFALSTGRVPSEFVCHRCDTPACVNPAHLYEGNAAQNSRDAVARRRLAFGTRNPNARLTMQDAERIRALYIPRVVGLDKLAAQFGVSQTAIHRILHHQTWAPPPIYRGAP